jgi:hypothetical protein
MSKPKNFNSPACIPQLSRCGEKLSVSPTLLSVVLKSVCDLLSASLPPTKPVAPQKQDKSYATPSKLKRDTMCLVKVKGLDLLKGDMSLVEVGWRYRKMNPAYRV